MDGARFANALVSLDVTPADLTWKSGVDILSFGGTKNGCWCAEAVVFMNPSAVGDFAFIRKRAAQLFSKSRFIAAQFEAYLADDLWLRNARHANVMAQSLAEGIANADCGRLMRWPEANEVFVILAREAAERARDAGARFYDWSVDPETRAGMTADEILCRMVASYATRPDEVEAVVHALRT